MNTPQPDVEKSVEEISTKLISEWFNDTTPPHLQRFNLFERIQEALLTERNEKIEWKRKYEEAQKDSHCYNVCKGTLEGGYCSDLAHGCVLVRNHSGEHLHSCLVPRLESKLQQLSASNKVMVDAIKNSKNIIEKSDEYELRLDWQSLNEALKTLEGMK